MAISQSQRGIGEITEITSRCVSLSREKQFPKSRGTYTRIHCHKTVNPFRPWFWQRRISRESRRRVKHSNFKEVSEALSSRALEFGNLKAENALARVKKFRGDGLLLGAPGASRSSDMCRRALFFLTLVLGAVAASSSSESARVLRLDASSFESSIAARRFVAVAFVAPWCAHCKRLEPEWRAAASKLAARGRDIALATLDTTAGDANAAFAARHDVRGFPSIKIFRDGDAAPETAEEYKGPRAASGLVKTMERLARSVEILLKTREEAQAFVTAQPVVVLGVFEDANDDASVGSPRRTFARVARSFSFDPDEGDDVPFGYVTDARLVPEQHRGKPFDDISHGDVFVYRDFDDRARRFHREDAKTYTASSLSSFVKRGALPLVATLDRKPRSRSVLRRVFAEEGPKVMGFAIDDVGKFALAETMRRFAVRERETSSSLGHPNDDASPRFLRFVVGNAKENANALGFFDVDASRLPATVIHDTKTDARYVLHDVRDGERLEEWLRAFKNRALSPTFRGADRDEDEDEDEAEDDNREAAEEASFVANPDPRGKKADVLVAKGFKRAVSGPDAPALTLIQFHAPWCVHCVAFAPTYDAVAAALASDKNVRVATFDAAAADVPETRFNVKGFPAVRLYRKADDAVVEFDGARTEKDLVAFVRKHLDGEEEGEILKGGGDGEL